MMSIFKGWRMKNLKKFRFVRFFLIILIQIFLSRILFCQELERHTILLKDNSRKGSKFKVTFDYSVDEKNKLVDNDGIIYKNLNDVKSILLVYLVEILEKDNLNNVTKCKITFEKSAFSNNYNLEKTMLFVLNQPYVLKKTEIGDELFFKDKKIENKMINDLLIVMPTEEPKTSIAISDAKIGEEIISKDSQNEVQGKENLQLIDKKTALILKSIKKYEEYQEECALIEKEVSYVSNKKHIKEEEKDMVLEYKAILSNLIGIKSQKINEIHNLEIEKKKVSGIFQQISDSIPAIGNSTIRYETKIKFNYEVN